MQISKLTSDLRLVLVAVAVLIPSFVYASQILVGTECNPQLLGCDHIHMFPGDSDFTQFTLNQAAYGTLLDIGEGNSFVWDSATAEVQLTGPGVNLVWQLTGFNEMSLTVDQSLPAGAYSIAITAVTGAPSISLWIDATGDSVGCCGSAPANGVDFVLHGDPITTPEPVTGLMMATGILCLPWRARARRT